MRSLNTGWLKNPTGITRAVPAKSANCVGGTALSDGKKKHRAAAAVGSEGGRSVVPQWCFPARRQHACSFASALADTAGAISEKLKTATSSDASKRRISLFYPCTRVPDKIVDKFVIRA